MSSKWVHIILIAVLWAGSSLQQDSFAQDQSDQVLAGVSFDFAGRVQPRFSFGIAEGEEGQRAGFGLRRGRVDLTVSQNKIWGVNYEADFGKGVLSTVDLFAFYKLEQGIRFRFGFFAQAQPRAYGQTSSIRLDGIERAAIARSWAKASIGSSGRDLGVDVVLSRNNSTLMVGLHNGDGNFSRSNVRDGNMVFADGNDDFGFNALAYSLYYNRDLGAGLEVGGYTGYNGRRSPNTVSKFIEDDERGRRYVSWASHIYWGANPGSQKVRLKFDLLGLHFEDLDALLEAKSQIGLALTGAVRVLKHGELYTRVERASEAHTSTYAHASSYLAAGFSYSLSARKNLPYHAHRITLGYQGEFHEIEGAANQHLVVFQTQFTF